MRLGRLASRIEVVSGLGLIAIAITKGWLTYVRLEETVGVMTMHPAKREAVLVDALTLEVGLFVAGVAIVGLGIRHLGMATIGGDPCA